jgi:hypothetical protein
MRAAFLALRLYAISAERGRVSPASAEITRRPWTQSLHPHRHWPASFEAGGSDGDGVAIVREKTGGTGEG